MILVAILIAIVACGFLWGALRGHYIFALALILIGGYELSAPLLFLMGEEGIARQALLLFAEHASEELVTSLVTGLLWFFLLFIGTYLLAGRLFRKDRVAPPSYRQDSRTLLGFPFVLFIFGLISVWTGAGQVRLEDYGWTGLQTTEYSRFFAYGGLMLVVGACLTLQHLSARHIWTALAVIVCATPLLVELFIAGRRQWFAPTFFFALLVLLYGNAKHKFVWASLITLAAAVVFAFQFGLREVALQGETTIGTEPLTYAVLAPQVTEFIAVGATSLYAWNFFAQGNEWPTLGFHWLFQALNAVPFVKLGDVLYPRYSEGLTAIYHLVAPWGGLSTFADALIALGFWGIPFAAFVLAMFCRAAHEYVSTALRNGIPTNLHAIHVLSLIATLLPKYRSGFGDAIQTSISFSILFWAIALVGYYVFTWVPRQPRQSIQSGS